ncbi:hypothetical protein, partial [Blastomonas sp.]|uniref:hypothetical protein n=1 Tax=Blastomonas sp. TaxID=1909299 RepID=UPI003594351E
PTSSPPPAPTPPPAPSPTPTPEPGNDLRVQTDVIEEQLDEKEQQEGDGQINAPVFLTPLIELREFEQFGYAPLIDEPVTGAGNEDLWTPLPPVEP